MRKYLGIFTILATLVIFTGCGNKTSDITNNDTTTKAETTTFNECKKSCDILTNATIKKEDCYILCETSKKLESDNIADCDTIDEKNGSLITKDICIQDKTIQAKKPEYCAKISETIMRDTCYMGLSTEMKDKKICNSIENEMYKSLCVNAKE
ncbi:MAG: hypothetical protein WC010_00800 [Candidatus Absconditabacterales bacterium]